MKHLFTSYRLPTSSAGLLRDLFTHAPVRFLSTLLLASSLILGTILPAQASHFRCGALTWKKTGPLTVQFTLTMSFRRTYFGSPNVGDVVSDGAGFTYGDGQSYTVPFRVTTVNTANDYIFTEATFSHTYSVAGNYVAAWSSCCRPFGIVNNPSYSYSVSSLVAITPTSTNNSPLSTLTPFVYAPVGNSAFTFQIPASDPDGDGLTFSLASPAEAGDSRTTQPPGFSVSPSGLASFNTVGKDANAIYNAIVKVSDGKSYILVDFLIQVVAAVGSPPAFVYGAGLTPADKSTIQALAGCPVAFSVQATDPDAGNKITLQGVGIPQGATFSSVTGSSPVSSQFAYTPSTAGSVVINFSATDDQNNQALSSVTIQAVQPTLGKSGTLSCSTPAVTLTASPITGASYAFKGPDGTIANTDNTASATKAGTYTVTLTVNGCSVNATTEVTGTVTPLTVNLNNSGSITCANKTVTLTATGADTYVFSGGATSTGPNTATVSQGGTYTVIGTSTSSGCSTSATTQVPSNTDAPQSVSLNKEGSLTCVKASVQLSAGTTTTQAVTYQFSGPAVGSVNGGSASATARGEYTVTIIRTDNGCSAQAGTSVEENKTLPQAVRLDNGGPLTCVKTSTSLTPSSSTQNVMFALSGPALNGNNATAPGQYMVTATDPANGCTAKATTDVSQSIDKPTGVSLGKDGLLTCAKTSVQLSAVTTTQQAVTYQFSGPAVGSINGSSAAATAKGDYTVIVTRQDNGCSAQSSTTVEENKTPPQAVNLSNDGPLSVNKPTVGLSASSPTPGVTYSFSNGAQKTGDNTATVTTSGAYNVTATRADNGCTAQATTTVLGAASPTVCRNSNATLNLTAAGAPVRYEWYLNAPLGSVLRDGSFYAGATTPNLTINNIQQTSIYYAKVYYADGSSAAYGPFRVNVNLGCNGRVGVVAEAGTELRITLLGNPLQGEALRALVEGAAGQRLQVELLDLGGRPVRSEVFEVADSQQAVAWSLSGSASGVYLLQALSGAQRQSAKLVKP